MKEQIAIIMARAAALADAFDVIQQPRSTYQIEHFVIGQHATEQRQYHQCVLEMSIKHDVIRRALLERRRLEIKKLLLGERPANSDLERELTGLDITETEWDIENTDRALLGAFREFDALYRIYERLPKFTAEQLQEAEPFYWRDRLERQAAQELSAIGTVTAGNLDALRQIGHPLGTNASRLNGKQKVIQRIRNFF